MARKRTSNKLPPWAAALGVPVAIGLVALLWPRRSDAAARSASMSEPLNDWIPTLLAKTSKHEGTYGSVQRNLDGNGVSYGILQWTQRGGGLYSVLNAMQQADPDAFARIFGPRWVDLLEHVQRKNMGTLDGALLWNEPWLGRFREAGRHGPFQVAQTELAARSEYMAGAVELAYLLGPRTERAMVLYYNRTVHQGVSGALKPARQLVAWWEEDPSRRPTEDRDVLAQYAWLCAAKFRRDTPPERECYNPDCTIRWRAVSAETELKAGGDYALQRVAASGVYHAVTGPWDLYELVTKRSSEILRDPTLRDVPVLLPALVS